MLKRFLDFAKEREVNSIWLHWNMTNINFGFETLEHRYRVLSSEEPYHINENNRYNLSKLVRQKHGSKFAKDPKMLNLMILNGGRERNFLIGEEEVTAYKAKEFVKLHNYGLVICKKLHPLISSLNKFPY